MALRNLLVVIVAGCLIAVQVALAASAPPQVELQIDSDAPALDNGAVMPGGLQSAEYERKIVARDNGDVGEAVATTGGHDIKARAGGNDGYYYYRTTCRGWNGHCPSGWHYYNGASGAYCNPYGWRYYYPACQKKCCYKN